jgi:hypothetical protein
MPIGPILAGTFPAGWRFGTTVPEPGGPNGDGRGFEMPDTVAIGANAGHCVGRFQPDGKMSRTANGLRVDDDSAPPQILNAESGIS